MDLSFSFFLFLTDITLKKKLVSIYKPKNHFSNFCFGKFRISPVSFDESMLFSKSAFRWISVGHPPKYKKLTHLALMQALDFRACLLYCSDLWIFYIWAGESRWSVCVTILQLLVSHMQQFPVSDKTSKIDKISFYSPLLVCSTLLLTRDFFLLVPNTEF